MVDLFAMEVGHASGRVRGKGESKPPIQGNVVILQHVVETALGAVLADDAQVSHVLDRGSDEFAQVRVVQDSACGIV